MFILFFMLLVSDLKAIDQVSLQNSLGKLPGVEGVYVRLGHDILSRTWYYYGPYGKKGQLTKSRMSCTQCHLESGTLENGNSWLDSHGSYPQFRARDNKIQTLEDRINVCLMHPMLGRKKIPEKSPEMKAMLMYFRYLNINRKILERDADNRLGEIDFLMRKSSSEKGQEIYKQNCMRCHGLNGQGKLQSDSKSYLYPPLWGDEAFMNGSSMSRISILARFIKYNMPFDKVKGTILLSDEQAWDVSAYILSKPRTPWRGQASFLKLIDKPYDYPIPPYADTFSNEQHKYGPFHPIINSLKQNRPFLDSTGI